jgi:soluble lytic murein transglycosylase-like protein
MSDLPRRLILAAPLALLACGRGGSASRSRSGLNPGETMELRQRINYWSGAYRVPDSLVHRVVQRESGYRPDARNGPYYGLMQLLPATARTMGHRGPPEALLHADTNLRYGVKYLRGAWLVAGHDPDKAVMWYSKGYYYEAKRKGLLEETGLRT